MLGGIAAIFSALGIVNLVISVFQYGGVNLGIANLGLLGVAGIFSALAFVGFLLYLVAMWGFSKDYAENKIFHYLLNGLITCIIVAVVAAAIGFFFLFAILLNTIPLHSTTPPIPSSEILSSITPYLLPLIPVFSAITLLWAWFNFKALNLMADKTVVPLFRSGAKVFVAGAALNIAITIAFAVIGQYVSLSFNAISILSVPGGIVQTGAWALLAKAYFAIKPPAPQITAAPPVSGQTKVCPNCGEPNKPDANYCMQCGQKI
jgi:uncharacterized membrane protein